MARIVPAVGPDVSLREACKLMREYKCSYIAVSEKEKPIGILTESDIVHRAVPENMAFMTTPVRDLMSHPVVSIEQTETMEDANALMKTLGFRHILVVDEEQRAVGMITLLGLLRYFEDQKK